MIFFDPEGARYQWLLKPGFRHVFCCIDDGAHWIMFDARDGRPVVQYVQTSDYDLQSFFEDQGYTVIEIVCGELTPRSPLIVANCVGLVKAILAVAAPFAQTPHQLYRHLSRR